MEPKGLLFTALIIGLLVLAMAIDQVTANALDPPDENGAATRKGPASQDHSH